MIWRRSVPATLTSPSALGVRPAAMAKVCSFTGRATPRDAHEHGPVGGHDLAVGGGAARAGWKPRQLVIELVEVAAGHRLGLGAQRVVDLAPQLAADDEVADDRGQHDGDRHRGRGH